MVRLFPKILSTLNLSGHGALTEPSAWPFDNPDSYRDRVTCKYPYLIITLIGAILFLPFLGHASLFDWDEINFAESAREMLLTNNFGQVQINFQPFWEKPPLFIWMQALSMSVFGVNEWAARLPNALCGIATLLLLFNTGKKYFSERFGWLWVMVYAGSFLPHLYFKSGIIDPVFNLFIFSGILQLISLSLKADLKKRKWLAIYAGCFLGLAVLTKGPVGLLMPLLCIVGVVIWKKNTRLFKVSELLLFLLFVFLISSLWYGIETAKNGPWFLQQFITYQIRLLTTGDSGHGGPIYYHFIVLLLGCFPASFLLFAAFRKWVGDTPKQRALKLWMALLLILVLVVFSLVKTKIVHYSSLAYIPLTFFATYAIYKSHLQSNKILKLIILASLFVGFLVGFAFLALPILGRHIEWVLPYIKDNFARACLAVKVDWPFWLLVPGAGYILAMLIAAYFALRNKIMQSLVVLFISTALVVESGAILFAGRIGEYSQGPAIDFFKSYAGNDVYLNSVGYKSYAPYFYGQKQIQAVKSLDLLRYVLDQNPEGMSVTNFAEGERQWHLHGAIDKPVYFCARIDAAEGISKYRGMKEIGRKGGFVFFERMP